MKHYFEQCSLCGDVQFLNRLGHLNCRLFNVKFYAVQQGALVDHHRGKVFEQHGEVGDGLGDLGEFAITPHQVRREIILYL